MEMDSGMAKGLVAAGASRSGRTEHNTYRASSSAK